MLRHLVSVYYTGMGKEAVDPCRALSRNQFLIHGRFYIMICLSIDGIKGNSNIKGYENSILVDGYHTSSKIAIRQQTGQTFNRYYDSLEFEPIQFFKTLDRSSIPLLSHFHSSEVIPQLTFFNLTSGNNPTCYLQNTFFNVIFSDYEDSITHSAVKEGFEFYYTKMERRFTLLNDGNVAESPVTIGL